MEEVHILEVMFVVLNREDLLDEILQAFLDLGISGATVLESSGMGRLMNGDVPIFAGLRRLLDGGNRTYNKTIFTVIRDKDLAILASDRIRAIMGHFLEPDTGVLFSIPVTRFFGHQWSKEAPHDN